MESICDKCKEVAYIESDTLITNRPCFLYSVFVSWVIILWSSVTFHNGIDTGGEIKLKILAGTYRGSFVRFKCPIYFNRGLYIDNELALNRVTIVYELASNKE